MKAAGWGAQRTKQQRKAARATVRLADVGIRPATQVRYYNGVRQLLPILDEIQSTEDLDDEIAIWIEEKFAEGEPLFSIGDALSGLHHFQPWTKGLLKRSWKLFGVWRRYETPMRAPPITQDVLLGFAGRCFLQGNLSLAVLLLVGFHTMLRTHEMLTITAADFLLGSTTGLLSIPASKSGVRHNTKESVTIHDPLVLEMARLLVNEQKAAGVQHLPLWPYSGSSFRNHFYKLAHYFDLDHLKLKCYSIRRGGATHEFQQHGLMEKCLIRGRWASTPVARLYITDGLSQIPRLTMRQHSQDLLLQNSMVFSTIEHSRRGKRGRAN